MLYPLVLYKVVDLSASKILLPMTPSADSVKRPGGSDFAPVDIVQKRRRILRLYLTAIFLVSAMLSYYIWQSSKMFEVKLRINSIEKDIKALENSNSDLRIEISKLQALGRIEEIATNDLGMRQPLAKQQLFIIMPGEWKK
ncbi:MAG: cell division protein FtsL [Candidatus Riflebacteria bacterium]|nr:cell division protein FtsL [Candidatus Riflebacteria bacterium]